MTLGFVLLGGLVAVIILVVWGDRVFFYASIILFFLLITSAVINGGTFGQRCYKAGHTTADAHHEYLIRLRNGGDT
jgi:hypothetical protein